MSRYIDADALKEKWLFRGDDAKPYREAIDAVPTADVVEVVRCKDCKHCELDELFINFWCEGRKVSSTHYCGYGERREDGN